MSHVLTGLPPIVFSKFSTDGAAIEYLQNDSYIENDWPNSLTSFSLQINLFHPLSTGALSELI